MLCIRLVERFSTTSECCVRSAHDTEQISTFFALAQQELSKMVTNSGKDRLWIAVLDLDGDSDFEDLLLLPVMEKHCKLQERRTITAKLNAVTRLPTSKTSKTLLSALDVFTLNAASLLCNVLCCAKSP